MEDGLGVAKDWGGEREVGVVITGQLKEALWCWNCSVS